MRSHLEYAGSVWYPYRLEHIESIERVQMRATKLVGNLRNMPYENRLKILNLPTLKYRRIRGDMIEVFKTINCIYDEHTSVDFKFAQYSLTRGHRYKLYPMHVNYDLRKYSFSNRVISLWNSLPLTIIDAQSIEFI